MLQRTSITFLVALLVFGSLTLLAGRAEAGSPSCDPVNGVARTPTGLTAPYSRWPRMQPPRSGPGNRDVETPLRRLAGPALSLLTLMAGLAGIAYSLRKLFGQPRGARRGQRTALLGSFAGKRAFAYALLVAVLGAG